jgi:hypothetical protein
MNSTHSPQQSQEFYMPATACRLGLALLAGLAGIAIFGWVSRGRVGALELLEQRTAVGDSSYYAASPAAEGPVLQWGGISYGLVPEGRVKVKDTRMTRVSRDNASGLSLYAYSGEPPLPYPASERYVKAAPGVYFRLSPR